MRFVAFFILACCLRAGATDYFVSSSGGSDLNNGTSAASPWKTFSGAGNHINAGSFNAGDVIYLKRGDTWNEQLIPPSSGTSDSPIRFDAYGTGAAPVLTPVINLAGAVWTHNSGNIYTTPLSTAIASPQINNLQLGSVWGRKRSANPGCASAGVIQGYGDYCVVYPTLYLYSPNGTAPSSYYSSIVAVVGQASGLAVVSVVNKSSLFFQHIKVQQFDYIGVGVTGTSDNLVFANMESDGMVPYGTMPHGFYVNVTNATNVQFLNDDAHLNYDGFHFVGGASGISVTNCRGYANRGSGLSDATGHARYSYSHFYGNNVAQFPTSDVVGGIAGAGNVSSAIAPVVTNFATYPARFSFTVDDVGMSAGTEGYINSFLTLFSSRGVHFNAAVVPSYAVDWVSVRNWYAAGNEIDSHSWSHQYYTSNGSPQGTCTLATCPNAPALTIQYTGSGTAATLTIAGNVLTTSVAGASGDNLHIDLTSAPYDTWQGLFNYLVGVAHYTISDPPYPANPVTRPNTHSVNLASVAGIDIKSTAQTLVYDQTKLVPEEMDQAKSAIETNVSGIAATFYVYPDGIEDPTTEGSAVAKGYTAARGSLAMKGQDNSTGSANSLYSNGVNVQNITSLSAAQIHGMSRTQINQLAASLVFRAAAWGVPYGLFTHFNSSGDGTPDISNEELGDLLDAVTANGGVWLKNSELAAAITSGTAISGTTRWVQSPTGTGANFAIAGANAPTVGRSMATAYPVDLNGTDRSLLGAWDVGASAYLSQRYGTGGGEGNTYIGAASLNGSVSLPQAWVNADEWIGTTANTIVFPSSGTGGAWSCGGTSYGPYTAGSLASLQQAVNDAEACRTANGSGTTITIPAGTVYSGSAGLILPQTVGDTSTNFIVLQSSTPLPEGQTVCSHGIQDNLADSTQLGIRNVGCNASTLSYQLGTTVTPVSGSFTLANGTAVNASDYNDLASMYTIEFTGANQNAVSTAVADSNGVGPHHFAILNAELRPVAGQAFVGSVVALGGSETAVSQIPTHIHLAYDYLHGDWTDAPVSGGVATGGTSGANSLPNVLAFSGCISCSLSYSYMDRALRPGAEGHAISNKLSQQIKVVHNWLEGQSSGMFCGGWSSAIPISGFVTCQDVEVRANRFTYPYSWILANAAGYCANGLACGGNGYVRKNAIESKTSFRYVMDGNIIENVDNSGGQNGIIASWKTTNSSGGAQGDNYWAVQADNTVTNNIFRNACWGAGWGFRSTIEPNNGGGVTYSPQQANFTNNLTYGMNLVGCSGVSPQNGFSVRNLGSGPNQWTGTAHRDATGKVATLTLTSQTGGKQTDTLVGDPVQVTCTDDASFNTDPTTMGPAALAGTSGLSVVYANTGTPNASASSCTYSQIQGYPRYLTNNHNSEFLTNPSFANAPAHTAGGGSTPYALSRNILFTNDIFIGGGLYSTFGEGTRTSTKAYDPATFVFHHNLFAGRDAAVSCPGHNAGAGGMAACYTEYSSPGVAVNPPVTLFGTPSSFCAGNDPVAENCTGVMGAMSQSSFPAVLNDWHQYRLCHAGDAACNGKASAFAGAATDGEDLGANISQIEQAQTSIQYCPGCGAGTFPDFSVPVVSLSPTSLSFGSQTVGTVSDGQVVTLQNKGAVDLDISSITTGTTDFHIKGNTCGGVLPVWSSCAVTVKFTPKSAGALTDSLAFATNASALPASVSLSGTGTSSTNPAVSLDPTSLAFGNVTVNTTSAGQTVTLTNSGSATLNITSISTPSGFAETHTCGTTLAALASCTVTVTFSPTSVTSYSGNLVFTTNAASSPDSVVLTGAGVAAAGSGLAASPFFGFTVNTTSNSNVTAAAGAGYGMLRVWDSPPYQWPSISTCPANNCDAVTHMPTYSWSGIDGWMQNAVTQGVTEVMYTASRTPPWGSSNSSTPDTVCTWGQTGKTGSGIGPGECYPPKDLNADGSGSNAIWKDWVRTLGSHAYSQWKAGKWPHMKYFEPVNEPDDACNSGACFYYGTIAQLARMYEDAACILLGSARVSLIHDYPAAGQTTACTEAGIDPTIRIVMDSNHAMSSSLQFTQNQLFCSGTGNGDKPYQRPCPVPANAIALLFQQVNGIINEHMKPGAESGNHCGTTGTVACTVETGMQLYVKNVWDYITCKQGTSSGCTPNLSGLELWDGEASFSPTGFEPGKSSSCPSCADYNANTNNGGHSYGDDNQASFYPRFYMTLWSQGITSSALYTWDSQINKQDIGGKGKTAVTQTIQWMTGATLKTPCSTTNNSLWSCTITKAGVDYLVMWDSSQACGASGCPTQSQSVATKWNYYQDMTTASSRSSISGHAVPVGIKPVAISQ